MTDRKPIVVVDNLHVKYRTYTSGKAIKKRRDAEARRKRAVQEVHALKGVSFVAREGDAIGVIGSNGSGKSTLMRAITGLQGATDGAVYAGSRPALIGVNAALLNNLSGARNVELGALALGLSRKEAAEKFDDIVDFAGVREFIDLPMRTYSSGMAARLRFSIAMAREHQILLVDEALAVGDKNFRDRSRDRIKELIDHAGTVFLVSHSMGSIRETCNRVLWIEKGVLIMDGDPAEVTAAYEKSQ